MNKYFWSILTSISLIVLLSSLVALMIFVSINNRYYTGIAAGIYVVVLIVAVILLMIYQGDHSNATEIFIQNSKDQVYSQNQSPIITV